MRVGVDEGSEQEWVVGLGLVMQAAFDLYCRHIRVDLKKNSYVVNRNKLF